MSRLYKCSISYSTLKVKRCFAPRILIIISGWLSEEGDGAFDFQGRSDVTWKILLVGRLADVIIVIIYCCRTCT